MKEHLIEQSSVVFYDLRSLNRATGDEQHERDYHWLCNNAYCEDIERVCFVVWLGAWSVDVKDMREARCSADFIECMIDAKNRGAKLVVFQYGT